MAIAFLNIEIELTLQLPISNFKLLYLSLSRFLLMNK